jgi:hypothetical protein
MFKKAVIVLMLLTTPFAQARTVLICSMMNGQIVEHCCCPGHGEGAPIQRDAPEAAVCCDVVVEVSEHAFASVSAEQPTFKRVGHDVPDTHVVATPAAIVPMFVAAARPLRSVDAASLVPYRLYLRTARLRL